MGAFNYVNFLKRNNTALKKQVANFQKIQLKQNIQILNFAVSHFQEILNENKDYLAYLKILTYSGLATRKTLRTVLYFAVQNGDIKTSLFFVDLLERELTDSEKSKIAKESKSLEFCEDYFPEYIAKIAAKGTAKAAQKAQENGSRPGGHKFRDNGNILG
jgi:hypothetical protein